MPDLKHESSVVIEAPPEEIYEYLSDLRRHTEWSYQPQEITKVSGGPVGVGTRYHAAEEYPRDLSWIMRNLMVPIMTKMLGSADYTVAEIRAMEPGRRLAWESWQPIRGDKRALEVHWEIVLEPQNGSTVVTQRSHWIPRHKMSDPSMLAESIDREVTDNLSRLKRIVERNGNQGNHSRPAGAGLKRQRAR